MAEAAVAPVAGGEPELEIARDLAKRGVWVLPVVVGVSALLWQVPGALSSLFALTVVVVNFLAAAFMNSRAARISAAVLGAAALFGFLFRLAVVFVAFWLARDAAWMRVVPFGLTVVLSHVGLLFWEMKYVSASLAFPGLLPAPTKEL